MRPMSSLHGVVYIYTTSDLILKFTIVRSWPQGLLKPITKSKTKSDLTRKRLTFTYILWRNVIILDKVSIFNLLCRNKFWAVLSVEFRSYVLLFWCSQKITLHVYVFPTISLK